MAKTMVLVDRDVLLSELHTVFDEQTADTLLSVLDKVAAQVYSAGVSREDFSELKQIVAELAGEQRNLAEEQRRLAAELRKLAEEQRRLTEAQRRTEEQLSLLTEQVKLLTKNQQGLIDDVGSLKGQMLELTYRNKTPAYFGRLLRKPKAVEVNDLWDKLETHLPSKELEDVLLIDLLVKGKLRHQPDKGDVYLAIEISSVVDKNDVRRAKQRAELLKRAGYLAIPVVAGENITAGADKAAGLQKVAVVQDGRHSLWDEAMEFWIKS